MRSDITAALEAALAKDGCKPVLLLHFLFPTGGTRYLSDRPLTLDVTYEPLVMAWGEVGSAVLTGFAPISAPEMQVSIANDSASPFSAALEANRKKATLVKLYLFAEGEGLTATDRLHLDTFKLQEPLEYNDEMVTTTLISPLVDLENPVGNPIDDTTWPYADPDDMGKRENIVYGAVKSIPCQCVRSGGYSTLVAGITAAQLFLDLSMADNEQSFPAAPYTSQCENEQIRVTTAPGAATVKLGSNGLNYTCILGHVSATGNKPVTGANWQLYWEQRGSGGGTWAAGATYKSARTAVVTRAYGGTTAAAHVEGRPIWEVRSDFKYLVAGHVMTSLDKVYVGGKLVTSGITKDVDDSGKATIVFSSKFTLQKVIDLAAADSGHVHAISEITTRRNPTGSSHTQSGSVTWTGTDANVRDQSDATLLKAYRSSGASTDWASVTATFPAYSGPNVLEVYMCITHDSASGGLNEDCTLAAGGQTNNLDLAQYNGTVKTQKFKMSGTTVPTSLVYKIGPSNGGTNYSFDGRVYEMWLEVVTDSTESGNASVSLSGNSAADMVIGGPVTCDGTGYDLSNPADIIEHFAETYCGLTIDATSFAAANTALGTAGYTFASLITGGPDKIDVLDRMRWQCRCLFIHRRNTAFLRYLATAPSSVRDLTKDDIGMSPIVSHSTKDELINKIAMYYNRDWTKDESADPGKLYMGIVKDSDATSITDNGEHQQPDLFMCEWLVTGGSDLAAFYLLRMKYTMRRLMLVTTVKQLDVEEGDIITLTHAAAAYALTTSNKFIVERVEYVPGAGFPDTIRITCLEI